MSHKRIIVVAAVSALVLTACSSDTSGGDEAGGSGGDSGSASKGGTLKLAGNADVLHLDPSSAYSVAEYQIHRATTRNLISQVVDPDAEAGGAVPAADLAVELPTTEN